MLETCFARTAAWAIPAWAVMASVGMLMAGSIVTFAVCALAIRTSFAVSLFRARVSLFEGITLGDAIVEKLAAGNDAVLVRIDCSEQGVLTGGHFLLGNLAVLVGVGGLQQAYEHHVLHHRTHHAMVSAWAATAMFGALGSGQCRDCGSCDQHGSDGR
jgi:hypothetical protein